MNNTNSKRILNSKPAQTEKVEQSYATFMGKVNLFTTWYNEKRSERVSEYLECIQKNIENQYIDKIYIMCDEGSEFNHIQHSKIVLLNNMMRATYRKMFEVINEITTSYDINIIANTDIYFDNTIKLIFNKINSNRVFCLTRWDIKENGQSLFHDRRDSQDAWIFLGKIRDGMQASFFLGKPGCDNRIAYEIMNAGYEVLNPSLSIILNHIHSSNIRNYSPSTNDRVPKPYVYLNPIKIDTISSNKKRVLHIGLNFEGQTSLTKALKTLGNYHSIDWRKELSIGISVSKFNDILLNVAKNINPDFIFMQIQTPDIILPSTVSKLAIIPILNWNGDINNHTPRWMLELAKYDNVHTGFTNGRDIDAFKKYGVKNVHYIQIGFEESIYNPDIKPNSLGNVVFTGSLYKKFPLANMRVELVEKLKNEFKNDFSVFGGGWNHFSTGSKSPKETAAIYRGSKFAISINNINAFRYTSDRLLNILATGTFCFAHYCDGLNLDFEHEKHLVYWNTVDELISLIKKYNKDHDELIKQIAYDGMTQVWGKHRWINRMFQITNEVLAW